MLDADDVNGLLSQIERGKRSARSLESQFVDFKTDKASAKETYQDIAEASVCFANSLGGTIVLGVADSVVGPDAFVGTGIKADELRSRIYALTEPSLITTIRTEERSGKPLLMVSVPEGLDVHSTTKGLVTRRWEDKCLPMRPVDVSRLDDERRGTDWSAQTIDRPAAEVAPEAVLRLRSLLRSSQDDTRQKLAAAVEIDLLAALRLVDKGRLTRAGEVLLCPDASSTAADVLVYQYRQTPGGEAVFVKRWGTPVVLAFTELLDVVTARVRTTPVNTPSGQQLQVEDYPVAAIREALANALLHGDYRERRPVQVEHSPDSLVVRSPGPLVAGITPENILTAGSRARFPTLSSAARTLGLAEELGQGVDRMFREMARTGRSTPDVSVQGAADEPTTVVAFTGGPPNVRVTRFVSELPEVESNDTDTLLVVLLLCRKKSVTARDVAPVIQRDLAATERILRRLASGEAELLEPTTGTTARAHPNYRLRGKALASLGPAVTYHRRSASDVDWKIVEHVREYGTVNSATVQRLFDVDVYQARDILADLVKREFVTRVSEQKRGPMVRYGPGSRFPERSRSRR